MNKLTMLDYVKETPGVLRTNIEQYTTLVDPLMKEVQGKEIKRILLVASGSSHNACYCARSFVEKVSGLEVRIITPYTFTYYENDIKENDLVLVVTQSGLSTNAIEALKIIKKKECKAICLTGNKNSEGTVAVHIRHLREKLEIEPSDPRHFKVVWGQGYKFE